MEQLGLGFHGLNGEVNAGHGFPGFSEVLEDDTEQTVKEPLLEIEPGFTLPDGTKIFAGTDEPQR